MSFSRQVKSELTRLESPSSCCRLTELSVMVLLRGYLTLREGDWRLSVVVDNNDLARRLFQLFKTAGVDSPLVFRQQERRLAKTRYTVLVAGREPVERLLAALRCRLKGPLPVLPRASQGYIRRRCCKRSFLRGAFLAGGTLSASRSGYHLEIGCSYAEDALTLQRILGLFGLWPSLRARGDGYSLYFKNSDSIAEFLRIIGASNALLHLENLRVMKSMRNRVNRLVNCDTANLDKIVNSAQRQLSIIKQVDRRIGLANLPPSLRETASLRLSFPEASLKELGEMLNPPLGKSGMNHRFRQLEDLYKSASRRVAGK